MSAAKETRRPWGIAGGLLAGSVVVLVGIWRDLAPDVILFRACVAGIVCGALAALARILFSEGA